MFICHGISSYKHNSRKTQFVFIELMGCLHKPIARWVDAPCYAGLLERRALHNAPHLMEPQRNTNLSVLSIICMHAVKKMVEIF